MLHVIGLVVYLLISAFITVYVGKVLYRNGRPFILQMLYEEEITDAVNRILLAGYYLVNLGYVSIMLTGTPPAASVEELVAGVSVAIGRIVLTLGVMHYFNIAAVIAWNKLNTKKNRYEHQL